jgi:hypothetical protein
VPHRKCCTGVTSTPTMLSCAAIVVWQALVHSCVRLCQVNTRLAADWAPSHNPPAEQHLLMCSR